MWSLRNTFNPSLRDYYKVQYGNNVSNLTSCSQHIVGTMTESYSVTLLQLLPATMYYFSIQSTNMFADFSTFVHNFKTKDTREFLRNIILYSLQCVNTFI